jgi:NAD(P)-dependent dehydrogenase (short-subunit alcohol dehydrogenase family)
MGGMPALVVLGAANLGRAILEHHLAAGWQGVAVSRSTDDIAADASDPGQLAAALASASERFGGLDLIVNAVSAARPTKPGPFGGGNLADATVEDFRGWTAAVAEQAFVFLSEGAKAINVGGTLIQVTGGSSRRAYPGRGLWGAGSAAARALTQAAAQELREQGIHVALLIVDATIESPKTAAYTKDAPPNSLADQAEIARAVEYLATQTPRGYTHELSLTPGGERWIP